MPLSDKDRRTLKIGGIVAGVLLVGILLMNLLSGGGSEPITTTARPSSTRTATPPPTSETPPASPVAQFAGRDPFSIPPGFSVATSPSGSSTSPTATPSGSSTSPTVTPTGSSTSPTPTPTQPGNGSSINRGGHEIVLLDVFPVNGVATVQVSVDGTVYNVSAGETFGPAGQFELRSVSGNCATFLFGDESFTLCMTPQK